MDNETTSSPSTPAEPEEKEVAATSDPAPATKKPAAKKPRKRAAKPKSSTSKRSTKKKAASPASEASARAAKIDAKLRKAFGEAISAKGQRDIGPVFSSGILDLDIKLGPGGFGYGRIYEIYGPESAGKSTLCGCIAAEGQRQGKVVTYIDAEHAVNPKYFIDDLGVDWGDLIFSQPDSAEQALDIVQTAVESGVDIVIVDSVAALTPEAELDGDMGDTHIGLQARLMSQAMRKLTSIISKSGSMVFFINQTRLKVGTKFGNPETTPGGNALKFYASARIRVSRTKIESLKAWGLQMKIVKNKLGPPYRTAVIPWKDYDKDGPGLDFELQWISAAAEAGVLDRKGAWYSFDGERLGQGLANTAAALLDEPEMYEAVKELTKEALMREK